MNTIRKQLCVLQIISVSALATRALAGNLTVVGNSTVASNLTINTAIAGVSNAFTWAQYDPMNFGYGICLHRTNDAYLTTTEGWGNRAALAAYSDTNKTVTELGFNPDGGQVSVGMMYGSSGFDVATNAVFYGSVTVHGKLYEDGGVDPAWLLLNSQTETSVVQQVARDVAPDKQDGAVLFFNKGSKRLEIYVPVEGTFYDLGGNVVTNVTQPGLQVTVGRRIWFDPATGDVVTNQIATAPHHRVRSGYQFDPTDGQFYQLSSSTGSNTVTRALVPKSQATILTQ